MLEWMQRIFARRQSKPPQYEQRGHALAWPARSDAGIFVSEDAAMSQNTAWSCGTLIARSIGMLPARVMAPRGTDDRDGNEVLPNHPVGGLLHREANPEISAMKFREGALLSAIFLGNAYAEIERDNSDRPVAIWPIASNRIEACRAIDAFTSASGRPIVSGELFYECNNGGAEKVDLAARDVFHLAGPSLAGSPVGVSLISYARNSIGLALAQEKFAGSFLRNQAAPSGMVKIKGPISPAGLQLLKTEFDQLAKGTSKAGKVLYGDGDWDWVPIGINQSDAQFLEQRRFSVEEVCRWFGVPPQMIGDTSKQTFANFEQAGLNFLALAILPWVVRFEQEANRKLLTQAANGRRPFLKINTAAIVRANLEAQYRAFALGRQWGWLSVNDIRRLIDMEPIGPEGDVYLQPMNMEPVGDTPTSEQLAEEDRRRAGALRHAA